ncbi:MAG: DUF1801 domain-containing protein [Candidatus Shapirobacteria bacterium]|jgi:uncharacterized protein YdhG (YjbR/CyaY superfamily)
MKTAKTIEEYIESFPETTQKILTRLRQVIRATAPEAEETIDYRIPTYKLNGNLVHFAAFSKHVGFYPTPSAIVFFKEELKALKQAKGSVQFPLTEELPWGLIRKIVKFRVKENLEKRR